MSFYVGAYWGERPESSEACAERLLACLGRLAEIDDVFTGWRQKGWTPAEAVAEDPVPVDRSSLGALVRAGRNRRDFDHSVIEELGYGVSLWNGNSRRSSGFSMLCGSFAGPNVANVFVLNLPREDDLCSWMTWEKARRIVVCLVTAWEPKWATLSSHEWREAQQPPAGTPVVGWLTYLSGLPSPPLPAEARSEPMGDGVLISASEDCNGQLSQAVADITSVLKKGGALQPPPIVASGRRLPRLH